MRAFGLVFFSHAFPPLIKVNVGKGIILSVSLMIARSRKKVIKYDQVRTLHLRLYCDIKLIGKERVS